MANSVALEASARALRTPKQQRTDRTWCGDEAGARAWVWTPLLPFRAQRRLGRNGAQTGSAWPGRVRRAAYCLLVHRRDVNVRGLMLEVGAVDRGSVGASEGWGVSADALAYFGTRPGLAPGSAT
jgi:hypothetical protein